MFCIERWYRGRRRLAGTDRVRSVEDRWVYVMLFGLASETKERARAIIKRALGHQSHGRGLVPWGGPFDLERLSGNPPEGLWSTQANGETVWLEPL